MRGLRWRSDRCESGYHDPTEHDSHGRPVLPFAGKVGIGFTDHQLGRLQRLLEPLAIDTSPFVGLQPAANTVQYVAPHLVAEVEFTEWTAEGTLRHPSYKGLHDDQEPADVVR